MSPSLPSNTVVEQTPHKTAAVPVIWLMDCLQQIFQAYGLPSEHARQVADVLVQADMRGMEVRPKSWTTWR